MFPREIGVFFAVTPRERWWEILEKIQLSRRFSFDDRFKMLGRIVGGAVPIILNHLNDEFFCHNFIGFVEKLFDAKDEMTKLHNMHKGMRELKKTGNVLERIETLKEDVPRLAALLWDDQERTELFNKLDDCSVPQGFQNKPISHRTKAVPSATGRFSHRDRQGRNVNRRKNERKRGLRTECRS